MLKIVSITNEYIDDAVGLLDRGFPHKGRRFWSDGVVRLQNHCRAQGVEAVGSILTAKGHPVGVLLHIPGVDAETGANVLNFSSWYVEPKYRWYALKMLVDAMSNEDVIYTDFTPSDHAIKINEQLGFKSYPSRVLLLVLALTAVVGRNNGELLKLEQVPHQALSPRYFKIIHSHLALGCIVAVIRSENEYFPLVFDVVRKGGIPVARVLYAPNMGAFIDNLKPISRFLLSQGLPFMTLVTPAHITVPSAFTLCRSHTYQVKGNWQADSINELFSERVILKV